MKFPKILVQSTALVGAVVAGYRREAHAGSCFPFAGTDIVCENPVNPVNPDGQDSVQVLGNNGAPVAADTIPGFGINTSDNVAANAIEIISVDGGRFTDENQSAITGGYKGLQSVNTGDGGLEITTSGDVIGETNTGIEAFNYGSGSVFITGNNVTGGAEGNGIDARNGSSAAFAGTDIIITTNGEVKGGQMGIIARNFGVGEIVVTAHGPSIVIGGNVGDQWAGIFAQNGFQKKDGASPAENTLYRAGANITVTGDGEIVGFFNGIAAYNYGSGFTKVHTTGDVRGKFQAGIFARNGAPETPVTNVAYAGTYVEVETEGTVRGLVQGIRAGNFGTGHLKITAHDDVIGESEHGILATNSSQGTYLTINAVNVSSPGVGQVSGNAGIGISATNKGSGALSITSTGEVIGAVGNGIEAWNDGSDIMIDVVSVSGGANGIDAQNFWGGSLSITTKGSVTAGDLGIRATTETGNAYLEVAGVVTGRSGIAIEAQEVGGSTRLELQPGFGLEGDDAAAGTDDGEVWTTGSQGNRLVFGGPSGEAAFDLSRLDDGDNTK